MVSKKRKADVIQAYIFLLPAVSLISFFVLFPIIYSLVLSFSQVNLIEDYNKYVGFDNYAKLFKLPNLADILKIKSSLMGVLESIFQWKDRLGGDFKKLMLNIIGLFIKDFKYKISLYNTFKYVAIVVPVQTFMAMVLASILNSGIRGQKTFRVLYFLPTLTSSAALTMIFMWIFNAEGLLNIVLKMLGYAPKLWLTDRNLILNVIIGMNIWATVPFFMTIYLAALQNIPISQYEAAKLDGANAIQRFIYITISHLKPITAFIVLTGMIGCFQVFDQAFILSKGSGGPANSTLTVVLLIYQYAFKRNVLGFAIAMAIVLAIVIMIFSYISDRLNREEKLYY